MKKKKVAPECLGDNELRRPDLHSICMPNDEWVALQAHAKSQGMGVSEFVRLLAKAKPTLITSIACEETRIVRR